MNTLKTNQSEMNLQAVTMPALPWMKSVSHAGNAKSLRTPSWQLRLSRTVAFIFITLIAWANPIFIFAQDGPPPGSVVFDFNSSNGLPLERGQIVSAISVDDLTMSIDVESNGANNVGMIFDTSNPGPDPDLGTPNEACPGGGPGIGPGGAPGTIGVNCVPLGNVLIIPRNVGPGFEPNDDPDGGVISLAFSEPVRVLEIHILDIDEQDSAPLITFWDGDGESTLEDIRPEVVGDNGHEQFTNFPTLAAASVVTIQVTFPGSGALDSIIVAPANPVGDIDIIKYVNGLDANDPAGDDVPIFAPGEAVAWTYHVTNTGQIPYARAEVVVTDSDPTVEPFFDAEISGNGDDILDPGEVWAYLAVKEAVDLQNPAGNPSVLTGICPADDASLPAENGYMNIGTVTVPDAEDTDPAHYCGKEPGIEIRKFVNGFDANDPTGTDVPRLAPGESITWTYHVTNTGQVAYPAAQVVVTDSDAAVTPVFSQILSGDIDAVLDPGEVWEYRGRSPAVDLLNPGANPSVESNLCPGDDATSPPDENGYRNIGTVTVPNAEDTDPAHYCGKEPGIEIRKFVNGFDANDPTGDDVPRLAPGESVTWTYHVTNTGEVPYPTAQVVVTDSDAAVTPVFSQILSGNGDDILDPGEVWEYTAQSQAVDLIEPGDNPSVESNLCPADEAGTPPSENGYRNIGTVTVPNAEDTDPAHYCGKEPGIIIRKFIDTNDANDPLGTDVPRYVPGELITWTYHITNTGELPYDIVDLEVTDSDPDVIPEFDKVLLGNDDTILDPGEVWQYAATGEALDLRDLDGSSLVIENGCPGIEIDSQGDRAYRNVGSIAAPGSGSQDPAHYCNIIPDLDAGRIEAYSLSYTVMNDGPVTVTDVQVFAGPNVTVTCPMVTLAPGESMICPAVATDIGFSSSTGWVVAMPVGGGPALIRAVSPDAQAEFNVVVQINGLTADAPPGPQVDLSTANGTVDLSVVVTNNGSVPLTNIQVAVADQDLSCNETTLAISESTACVLAINAQLGPQVFIGGVSAQPAGAANGEKLMQELRVFLIGE